MPGTLASDALAVVLNSAAITSKTTTTGTGVEVAWPGDVQIEMVLGTLTGSAGTADVEIQGSDVSNFGSGVVSYGRFAQFIETATGTRRMNAYVNKRYMRAVIITAGTTVTTYTITITVRPEDYQRTPTTTA